jgi:hypothetical protein
MGYMEPLYDVVSVRVKPGYELHLEFSNGERRIFDMSQYMDERPFASLKDSPVFGLARVEFGTVVWPGEIDIGPETLYHRSRPEN